MTTLVSVRNKNTEGGETILVTKLTASGEPKVGDLVSKIPPGEYEDFHVWHGQQLLITEGVVE